MTLNASSSTLNSTDVLNFPLSNFFIAKHIENKFALLWGEAQLSLPYLMFACRKELPIVTLR